jgi:sulfhydrogenase subunit delta
MKPKVAFFDFAGCEGDQLQIANLEEDILGLLDLVDIVSFREVMKEHSDNYDIAFVEGSCTRLQDEDRLRESERMQRQLLPSAHAQQLVA